MMGKIKNHYHEKNRINHARALIKRVNYCSTAGKNFGYFFY